MWLALCFGLSMQAVPDTVDTLFGDLRPGEKGVVLMVHFGSTYDETRGKTYDALNEAMRAAFPDIELREAYTSRIVIKRLKARGIEKQNPVEALQALEQEGFTHVLVQTSNIIDGIEISVLRQEVEQRGPHFKQIRMGKPLLYSPEDYTQVVEALTPQALPDGATLFVGHGTSSSNTAQYAMLDYVMKAMGHADMHVATIEGYPTLDTAEALIKASGRKKIRLIPFLFVAGDHAQNDIAGDWKTALEAKGYEVETLMQGLGEEAAIRQLFIHHAQAAAETPWHSAAEEKNNFIQNNP